MFLGFFLYRKRETNEAWHHTLQKELLRLKKKVLNIWFEIAFHLGSVSRSESRGSHGRSRAAMCYSIWVLPCLQKRILAGMADGSTMAGVLLPGSR